MIEGKLSQWLEQAPKQYFRLFDIESARVVKQAIMDTDMKIEGVDYFKALRYLKIVGAKDYM